MTGSVLFASPAELHQAARVVRGLGGEAQALAGRIGASAAPQGWTGVAALARQARAQSLADLVRATAEPAQELAGAVERCAQVAEDAGAQVLRWRRVVDDALVELTRLRAVGPPPEPELLELWRRRLEELEREVATARRRIAEAEDDFAAAQQRAAEVVAGAWSVVEDLGDLKRVRRKVRQLPGQVVGTGLRVAYGAEAVVAAAQARWAGSAALRAQALARARSALDMLQSLARPGTTVGRLRVVPGPPGLVLTWIGALSEVRTGAGYDGWRGTVTRVTAGGALLGGPLILAGGLLHPVVPAIGVALVGLHQAWMTCNLVWDGVGTALRYARRLAPAVRHVGEQTSRAVAVAGARATARLREVGQHATLAGRAARARVEHELRDVGVRVATHARGVRSEVGERLEGLGERLREADRAAREGVQEQTRRALDEVLTRTPEGEQLKDWWRSLGEPLRLPGGPLLPGLPGGPLVPGLPLRPDPAGAGA